MPFQLPALIILFLIEAKFKDGSGRSGGPKGFEELSPTKKLFTTSLPAPVYDYLTITTSGETAEKKKKKPPAIFLTYFIVSPMLTVERYFLVPLLNSLPL